MPKVDTPAQSGLDRNQLNSDEESALKVALQRSLDDTRTDGQSVMRRKYQEYEPYIKQAAEVAKARFDKEFDGTQPVSGKFGLDTIHSGYFGWDSWDNLGSVTAGTVATWLDGDTPDNLNSGNGGENDPMKVGKSAVHLVFGIGSRAASPKTSRVRFRLNDQPRPAISTEDAFRNTDLRVKWLDTPIILKEEDQVYAELFPFADGEEALYPVGVSFVEQQDMREIDPANMAGTDANSVVYQG